MKLLTFLLAVCWAGSALAECQGPHCFASTAAVSAPRPVFKKYWNQEGMKKYSMDAKDVGKFRAELVKECLTSLIAKAEFGRMDTVVRRELAAQAVCLADETLIAMGLLTIEQVTPEAPPVQPKVEK